MIGDVLADSQHSVDRNLIALAVQQPWAELILRGIKTLEVRSVSSGSQTLISLYSSRTLSRSPSAALAIQTYGLDRDSLITGAVVGTVTISRCRRSRPADASAACISRSELADRYCWELKNPQRIEPPLIPDCLPYGMWFYPFRRSEVSRRRKSTTDDSTA